MGTLIENNLHHIIRDIAEVLQVFHMSIVRHLSALGYVNCYDVWVLHNPTEQHLMNRISVSDMLLKFNNSNP
ncbi:hypothetical protein NL493_28555, partial [Klebsiella pneumoniae]|nr:hypothetical protein [Klebsiella pneumoniae]